MKYYRCRCGKREHWNSGFPIYDCQGCRDCNTTIAGGPEGHRTPVPPHQMARLQVESDEGEAFEHRCWDCMASRSCIEKRGEPWEWQGGSPEAATRRRKP